ncbi:MAG TPA: metallophosphoesterase family protein, partial [Methylomirabilota bacterium]|nr:metallophosphoesterase family protein [Methylomirabilota bacterium]
MRYAILSDIHANLEALRAVLADAAGRADGVLCLGDTVGYGADPLACVEVVAERAQAVVAGNHEYAVADRLDLAWFNQYARAAAEWTRAQLDDDHRAWLAALPLVAEVGDATLVHASPAQPEEWDYLVGAEDGYAVFGAFATRWCFVGHSHVPVAWSLGSSGPDYRPGP